MAASGLLRLYRGFKDGQETDEIKAAWKRLCRRKYHLHCVIQNDTKSTVNFEGEFFSFNSGEMFIAPPREIFAGTKVTFGVGGGSASGDFMRNIAMGAVSGGAKLRVENCTFSVGFSDPIAGDRKAGVSSGTSAEDGYKAISSKGNSIVKDGYRITASINAEKRLCTYRVEKA